MTDRGAARRRVQLILAAVLAVATLGAGCDLVCCTDYRWNLWVLNDSGNEVLVTANVDEPPRTIKVPANSYLPLATGHGGVEEGWSVAVVDAACRPLQTVMLKAGTYGPLLYVSPESRAELRAGSPWTQGLGTATGAREPFEILECPPQ
jgi:hypothetical protein